MDNSSTDIFGAYSILHEEQENDHAFDLPDYLVEKKDITRRIRAEIMSGIVMKLVGDHIYKIINILNKHFNRTVYPFLIGSKEKDRDMAVREGRDIIYPVGDEDDGGREIGKCVHWIYENGKVYDGYSQMKQEMSSQQFCQVYAIGLAYYPRLRKTVGMVKDKKWFTEGNQLIPFQEAYKEVQFILKDILPIILTKLTYSTLVDVINQMFIDQYEFEDERYLKRVDNAILKFLAIIIPSAKIRRKRKQVGKLNKTNVPTVLLDKKQKGQKITAEQAGDITTIILKELNTKWSKTYLPGGRYHDYDKE